MEKLTVDALKQITTDPNCIKVVNALFEAIAYAETVRAIIEPKEQEVVDFFKFKVKEEIRIKWDIETEIIDTPDKMYLAEKADYELYWKEMNKFHNDSGFRKKSPDHCPLLEAEELVRCIKIQVCDFLEPYLKINYSHISGSLPRFKQYFDLVMHLFGPAVAEYQKINPLPVK